MLKIKGKNEQDDKRIIAMSAMNPLEVGVVVDEKSDYLGHYVLRTASTYHLEVINITTPRTNRCWTQAQNIKVRLLNPDEKINIELYNEE